MAYIYSKQIGDRTWNVAESTHMRGKEPNWYTIEVIDSNGQLVADAPPAGKSFTNYAEACQAIDAHVAKVGDL